MMLRTGWVVVRRATRMSSLARSMVIVPAEISGAAFCGIDAISRMSA